MSTAVFFGSSTGNTEAVAEQIADKLNADLFNVADNPIDKIDEYNNLVFGTSTWGIGDLQDDWETFILDLEKAELDGKVVAIFGLGDAGAYADSFVDGIGTIYEAIKDKACKVVGQVSTSEYSYEGSTAEVDGKFIGLPLDEDNEPELTKDRISTWTEQIKPEFN